MRKRKVGDKKYLFGFQLVVPSGNRDGYDKITFQGEFDQRQLRKMVRNSLTGIRFKTEEIDYIIREFGTPLRPLTAAELVALSQNA
jgi:hypothetical protein